MKIIFPLLILGAMVFAFFLSCDSLFPTQSKSTVPSDHTVNRKGALHKSGLSDPLGVGECGTAGCHGADLNGSVAQVNGKKTVAPSCYQCHGALWEGGGGGDGGEGDD